MREFPATLTNLIFTTRSSFARKIPRNLPKPTQAEPTEIQQEFLPFSKQGLNHVQDKLRKQMFQKLSYEGEDPTPNKLVNRPGKGAVWGLGGQLVLASKKMELEGIKQEPDQIVKFLELHQVKNIYIHDWQAEEDLEINRRRYSIIGSCFSAKHCWKTGLELKNAFNNNVLESRMKLGKKKIDMITALLNGNKDEEWTMVEYKDFEVSLMTEEQREAVDLEWKWNNPVCEDVVERHSRLDNDKKQRKSHFEDFD